MISLDMPTFRLVVAMVAEFRSLIILIHNTLLGEIMTRKYSTSIPYPVMIHSTCKDSSSLILWLLRYASSNEEDVVQRRTWQKCGNRYYVSHITTTSQHNQFLYTSYFSCALYPDIIKSVQIESENILMYMYMVFNGDRP